MKQRYIILISILIATMFIMIAYSSPVDKNANNINDIKSDNNYVKIGNITFMNNYISSNNGIIKSNNINKTSISNINKYSNIYSNDNSNNKTIFNAYKGDVIHKNNINYTLLYFKNMDVKNAITFTEKFKDYKVQIADIIFNENNNTISYIYANILPLNSSKILLGNEFTLNYKNTYNNEMKTLINNIGLISFNYMNSNNNTINKFGIEYSYIAMAMNNMLKLTNNNIKNITIDKTNAIAIDDNWACIDSVAAAFIGGGWFEVSLVALLLASGPIGWVVFGGLVVGMLLFGLAMDGIICSC